MPIWENNNAQLEARFAANARLRCSASRDRRGAWKSSHAAGASVRTPGRLSLRPKTLLQVGLPRRGYGLLLYSLNRSLFAAHERGEADARPVAQGSAPRAGMLRPLQMVRAHDLGFVPIVSSGMRRAAPRAGRG